MAEGAGGVGGGVVVGIVESSPVPIEIGAHAGPVLSRGGGGICVLSCEGTAKFCVYCRVDGMGWASSASRIYGMMEVFGEGVREEDKDRLR